MKYTKAQRKAIYEKALKNIPFDEYICVSIIRVIKLWGNRFPWSDFPEFELHKPENHSGNTPFSLSNYNEDGVNYLDFQPIREQILLNCIELCK